MENLSQFTGRVFNDLDNLLIFLLNEISQDDRSIIYRGLVHISDNTVSDYHSLVKLILETADLSQDADSDEDYLYEHKRLNELRRLIFNYQESIMNLLELVKQVEIYYSDSEILEDCGVNLTALNSDLSLFIKSCYPSV